MSSIIHIFYFNKVDVVLSTEAPGP